MAKVKKLPSLNSRASLIVWRNCTVCRKDHGLSQGHDPCDWPPGISGVPPPSRQAIALMDHRANPAPRSLLVLASEQTSIPYARIKEKWSLTPCPFFLSFMSVSEGLAVGVGFGAVEKTASATFESAR